MICGHIHHAEIARCGDILYINDGDWVESCTAVVEDFQGRFEILRWTEQALPATAARQVHKPRAAA